MIMKQVFLLTALSLLKGRTFTDLKTVDSDDETLVEDTRLFPEFGRNSFGDFLQLIFSRSALTQNSIFTNLLSGMTIDFSPYIAEVL